jgi:hypothetical protein
MEIYKNRSRIAPQNSFGALRFRITHPYHPLSGQEFEVVFQRRKFTEDRIYFHDATGTVRGVPAQFTSLAAADPFRVVSAGRSCFRFEELLELAELIECLKSGNGNQGGPRV